ncbi:glycohydrolase toxin TNT-related protein [Actinokineospora auranticolor]|uniref:Type III secretion system (T3SS) SseB-like protein n=1 Tax=Actinokineospora auranticolor TaxID=155976 RepID=A0A2S6GJD9_9PSEU|nr:glycohydrolase toxin TNT-related protein [Actinokineospora auranticolor]PPK65266.1 type III secretion system (T3SS) SseB-like protein [Actinokineospora auranticolor]
MSTRIGFSGDSAVVVEEGPGRTGYVDPGAPVDGRLVTLPDGRTVKQVTPADFESLVTVRTLYLDSGDPVAGVDPLAGHLSSRRLVVHLREGIRDESVAVWFPGSPSDDQWEVDSSPTGDVLAAIDRAVAAAAPEGWHELLVECEAVGARLAVWSTVTMADGAKLHWAPPAIVGQWFHRMRAREYKPHRGVWHHKVYRFKPGQRPAHVQAPLNAAMMSEEDAADELRLMPRNLALAPERLLRLAVASEQSQRAYFAADEDYDGEPESVRLFDGVDESGKPIWYRPVLGTRERAAVSAYLRGAPVVLSARGVTVDQLDPDRTVPMGFHTDGRYVWPSAAAYYLDAHGVPPAMPLLEHIRAARHRLPADIPTLVLDRAAAVAMGRPWDEPAADALAEQVRRSLEPVIVEKRISPRFYSLFTARDRAWSILRVGDRYRVQWGLDQRTAVDFADVGQAVAHLTGQLFVNAEDLEFQLEEEIPAWQSPLAVLGDDPPVAAFAAVTTVMIENLDVDRYGGPDGNLVFRAGTPFEQRGLPPEFAQRPYHRYRISGAAWQVVAVTAAAGGVGYVLPESVGEYVRSGHLREISVADHPGLPPVTDAMRAEAARTPGGWVYCADPDADPQYFPDMPSAILLGGHRVGPDGRFTGETWVNDEYRPSPRRRGYPEPQTPFEQVLGYVAAGWLAHEWILAAAMESPFILESDGRGGLRIGVDANGRQFLVVYSSPRFVPPNAQNVQQADGRDLAKALAGLTLVVNPGGGFGIELPGDDLVLVAAGTPPA